MIYYTRYGGEKCFMVEIENDNVKVFKPNDENHVLYNQLVCEYTPLKIFIGLSPKIRMTVMSGYFGMYDGNSILLHINNDDNDNDNDEYKYVFICNEIFSFTTKLKILSYVSPIGDNCVPYPYAVDKDRNFYLMVENVCVSLNSSNDSNPYDYYYHIMYIIVDQIHSMMDNIQDFYIGRAPQDLYYSPAPHQNYQRLTNYGAKKMYVVKTGKQKEILTKNQYIDLMERFGEMIHCSPLRNRKIIQDR